MRTRIVYIALYDLSPAWGEAQFSQQVIRGIASVENTVVSVICPAPAGDLEALKSIENVELWYIPTKDRGSIRWHAGIQADLWGKLREVEEDSGIDAVVSTMRVSTIAPLVYAVLGDVPYLVILEAHGAREIRDIYRYPGVGLVLNAIAFANVLASRRVFSAFGGGRAWATRMPCVDEGKIECFHHGVHGSMLEGTGKCDAIPRTALGLGGGLVIGFAGSFQWYHRVDLLIEAVATLEDESVQLLLVGDGPERAAIDEKGEKLGLKERMALTGSVPPDAVGSYLRACDVCYGVIDSGHLGHPMKIYEYMAAGKPFIATRTPDTEFVEDIGAGLLVDNTDVSTVAEALRILASCDHSRLQAMGQTGHTFAVANCRWEDLGYRIVTEARRPRGSKPVGS